jgi:hypothetical protein
LANIRKALHVRYKSAIVSEIKRNFRNSFTKYQIRNPFKITEIDTIRYKVISFSLVYLFVDLGPV